MLNFLRSTPPTDHKKALLTNQSPSLSCGKKRKAAKLIPVQTTAKARRLNPSSGRGTSTKGRHVKDLPKLVKVTEAGVFRSLPKQKPKPVKQAHSLIKAVRSNKSSAKNHTAQ